MNNRFNYPLFIQDGVVFVDQKPMVFNSSDYPYYRDESTLWTEKLIALKKIGIQVISAYIPWRHHQIDPAEKPDFSGRTQSNRDAHRFLNICQENGLSVILKPGPFIHGELNFGGLPDWTCPAINPKIEPLLNSNGESVTWDGSRIDNNTQSPEKWPLPAPFGKEFLELTRIWFSEVEEHVIRVHSAEIGGPIIAIQVGNEGIYSNGQHAPWAFDYSPSGVSQYQLFLRSKYKTIEEYNLKNSTTYHLWDEINPPCEWKPAVSDTSLRKYLDWGEYLPCYLRDIYLEWYECLKTDLPLISNQNPPLNTPFGIDSWLTRVNPELWKNINYGFTNWVGDVSADPSAFNRYIITAKRKGGLNMEENWGFAELYAPAYVDASTSFFQTLMIMNNGATGFNIYTGAGTGKIDCNLDVTKKTPYPDCSPITEKGVITTKAEIASWLLRFFDLHGEDFLSSVPRQCVAWGYYLPHVILSAWASSDWSSCYKHGYHMMEFQKQMRELHLDYSLVNLELEPVDKLLAFPVLFVTGGGGMAETVQEKLVDYVNNGRKLIWIGEHTKQGSLPQPFDILNSVKEKIEFHTAVAASTTLADQERPHVTGIADVWIRSHQEKLLDFVTILLPSHSVPPVEISYSSRGRDHSLLLHAVPSGGAILRIQEGRLTDCIIKGNNDFLNCSISPSCVFDGEKVGINYSGDYARLGNFVTYLVKGKVE